MPLDQQGYCYEAAQVPETIEEPTLPDKLSALILVALDDLGRVEASSQHTVHMSRWHDRISTGPMDLKSCHVCFAGGVMAFSLNAQSTRTVSPHEWGEAIRVKLYALNSVRVGLVSEALALMGHHDVPWPHELWTSLYGINPSLFKSQMRDLASRLATAGY